MSTTTSDLQSYCQTVASQAKQASYELSQLSGEVKNRWLRDSATALRERLDDILAANKQDLAAAPGYGLTDAQTDRLCLNQERVEGIARALEEIAMLEDPIGEVMSSTVRPNGLDIQKVRVPLGVVFFIYESRPNVTADAAAICVKSGNAVILRGGKEAMHSSQAIVRILSEVGESIGLPKACGAIGRGRPIVMRLVFFLSCHESIDVAIPRGGEGLIRRVAGRSNPCR